MTEIDMVVKHPKVAVCLAAYNGVNYIKTQVETILSQINVDLTVFVSVDLSSDGTEDFVDSLATTDHRIRVLQHGRIFGGAASNFFRILRETDFSEFEYVSFADQDDVWDHDKLSRHIALARENNADGISSNVMAFWPNGKERLIVKSQPQRQWDFLFESAGPGCTFLMSAWLVGSVKKQILDSDSLASSVALHDWLAYAICRASERIWVIDSVPSLRYRQHQNNVLGSNAGFKAKWSRLLKLKDGWYRGEVCKICDVCFSINQRPDVLKIYNLVKNDNFFSNMQLFVYIPQIRRKFADRVLLALSMLVFLF